MNSFEKQMIDEALFFHNIYACDNDHAVKRLLEAAEDAQLGALVDLTKDVIGGRVKIASEIKTELRPYADIIRRVRDADRQDIAYAYVRYGYTIKVVKGLISPVIDKVRKRIVIERYDAQSEDSNSDIEELYCDECDKNFHSKTAYTNHTNTHLRYEEKPFVCDTCDRRYASSDALRHHVRKLHHSK